MIYIFFMLLNEVGLEEILERARQIMFILLW